MNSLISSANNNKQEKKSEKLGELLETALEELTDESIIDLTLSEIHRQTDQILVNLTLPNEDSLEVYRNKLKEYRYVSEYNLFRTGACIYFIPLTIEPHKLWGVGFICEINMTDLGTIIRCKNFKNKYFTIVLEECHVFQKLSPNEMIILKAMDLLKQ